jgi:formylglycine-generating enzyme required for sulfatase activity
MMFRVAFIRFCRISIWLAIPIGIAIVATIAIRIFFPRLPEPDPSSGLFVNELGMEFVWIPSGNHTVILPNRTEFSDETKSGVETRSVPVDGFWISRYELTQKQAERLDFGQPSIFPGPRRPDDRCSFKFVHVLCERLENSAAENGLNLSYRLPNELEWEFACYGTPEDELQSLNAIEAMKFAWFDVNSKSKTHEVGKRRPNSRGLYDIYGNVWELCTTGPNELYDNERLSSPFVEKGGAGIVRCLIVFIGTDELTRPSIQVECRVLDSSWFKKEP